MKSGTTGTTKCYLAFVIVTCLMPLLLRTGTATIATTQPHNGEFPTATLHNGIRIPLIGLGCASGVRKSHVQSALSLGYQLLDTAQASQWGYHEDEVGRALTDFLKENNSANVFLQTKIHPEDLGYEATTNAVHKSLERLNGYLDSVLIHKPRCWEGACSRKSEGTWQDSWRALEDLYDQGLIKAIGICDVDDSLLNELLRQRIKPHIIQSTFLYFFAD
jgi:diketogulonate reductase-like aldo/keto reductase